MTPQQIEALKLALEALKDLQLCTDDYYDCSHEASKKGDEAITAIKEVLAEHAMQEVQRLGQEIEPKIGCVNHDCDQCKAQPEQEPVTTVTSETGADITMSWWHEPALPIGTKLYATPPQRTWVGLTNGDWNSTPYDTEFRAGAEWAEAKLKEKNNA